MIAAGRLDRLITLIPPNYLTDDAGQTANVTLDPEHCPEVPAMVQQPRAATQVINNTVRTVNAYAITIRHQPDLTREWMLDYRGRRLRIEGITEVGRWEEQDIVAVEVR